MNVEVVGKLLFHKIVPDQTLNKKSGLKSLTYIDTDTSLRPYFG